MSVTNHQFENHTTNSTHCSDSEEEVECCICMEDEFTKTNPMIQCKFCDEVFCRTCVQRYSTSTTDQANCPRCKTKWSLEFFQKAVKKSFAN